MADPNTLTESTKDKQVIEKKISKMETAAAKIGQYALKHLQKVDPESSASTSHKILLVDGQQLSEGTSILPHDGQKNQPVTADVTPAVSVICKLVFSSSSQSSDTSMSAPEPCTKEFTPIDKPPDECKNAPDITDAISCDRKTVTERQVETPCDSSAIQSKSAALSDVLQQQNTDRNISDSHASTINKHDRAKITNVNSEKPDSDSVWDASNTESHLPPQESPSDFQAPNNAEVTEAELILHYSPSQTAESEYFHTEDNIMQFEVPETELESEECDPGKTQTFKTSYENMMNKGSDTDSGTSDLKSTESDSSMFKSVDDGNPTACPSADANDTKMKVDSSVTSSLSPSFLLNLQQTPPTCRGPIDNKDTFSVEKQCNDYERSEE